MIGADGDQIGILPVKEALLRAQDAHLDLVEVSPNSRPPVCRIMDFGKFKYEQSKKARQAKKKQHVVQMRAMRYRPKIDEHDFQFKTRHVKEFLEKGSKVKISDISERGYTFEDEKGNCVIFWAGEYVRATGVEEDRIAGEYIRVIC